MAWHSFKDIAIGRHKITNNVKVRVKRDLADFDPSCGITWGSQGPNLIESGGESISSAELVIDGASASPPLLLIEGSCLVVNDDQAETEPKPRRYPADER